MDAVNDASTVCDDGLSIASSSISLLSLAPQSVVEVVLVPNNTNNQRAITLPITEVKVVRKMMNNDEVKKLFSENQKKLSRCEQEVFELREKLLAKDKEWSAKYSQMEKNFNSLKLDKLINESKGATRNDSSVFEGLEDSVSSKSENSDLLPKLIPNVKRFFEKARKFVEGLEEGSVSMVSLVSDDTLSTDEAQKEVEKAQAVVVEILLRVGKKVGDKVGEKIAETTGIDIKFLNKMANTYEKAQEKLSG